MSSVARGNHKLLIDTTFDPRLFSLYSPCKNGKIIFVCRNTVNIFYNHIISFSEEKSLSKGNRLQKMKEKHSDCLFLYFILFYYLRHVLTIAITIFPYFIVKTNMWILIFNIFIFSFSQFSFT
jgi:hypothetical protein